MKDIEVLSRLRHHPVVGSNGEQNQVHSVRARKHVPDESLVTRDVHDPRPAPVRQIQVCKSQID